MKLSTIYKKGTTPFSFEVFPPKTADGNTKLLAELKALQQFDPAFISVTYGAGGTTQERSISLIKKIKEELKYSPLPHFTCVGSNKKAILNFTNTIEALGIHNILALRGDPPQDKAMYRPEENAFTYADELVTFLKEKTTLDIAVAAYPEVHPESQGDLNADLIHLKKKVDAGASVIITQLFFENKHFFNFVHKARLKGITIPIVPGILPATSIKQIEKVVDLCNAFVPQQLRNELAAHAASPEKAKEIGIAYAIKQVKELLAHNVPGIHFYPLNNTEAVIKVLENIKNI